MTQPFRGFTLWSLGPMRLAAASRQLEHVAEPSLLGKQEGDEKKGALGGAGLNCSRWAGNAAQVG